MVMIARWNQTSTEKLFRVFNSGGWAKKKKGYLIITEVIFGLSCVKCLGWTCMQCKIKRKNSFILTLGLSLLKYFRWQGDNKYPKPIFISRVSVGTLFGPRKEEVED